MRQMKDSGIEWIGEIPQAWGIGRIGSYYSLRNIKVSDREYEPLSVTKQGVLPQLENVAKTDDNDNRKLVRKGDFVINSRSDRRNSCGISNYIGSVSLINTVLCPRAEMNGQYYNWLFHTEGFADEFYRWGHGIVDDLWTTNWRDMKKISIPVPPLAEQERIAEFLDEKCAEVDALAGEIKEQIATLEEYKRSVITEAVTKGLDASVPMKDSGIEWIGEIPQAWDVRKGKYLFAQRNERGNNVKLQLLSPTQNYGVIPQDEYERLSGMSAVKLNENINLKALKTIHKGDYCISLRSFQGGFEYSMNEGVISPAYQVFYPTVKISGGYYKYLFKDKGFISVINSYAMSLRDGKNISFEQFGNTVIPVPPLAEQERIAEFLDAKCAEVDALIAEKQNQLSTLEEYKKSVIFEYVTGKKEVV